MEGAKAYALLVRKASRDGVAVLWSGALANAAANFVGGYPWFLVFNSLDASLPRAHADARVMRMVRNAALGCSATAVSAWPLALALTLTHRVTAPA